VDAGVDGIVLKSQPIDHILDSIIRVAAGELVVPSAIVHHLGLHPTRAEPSGRTTLTARELDVLEWLARGESTVQVATRLCISNATVRNHLARVMLKLGVHDRLTAVTEGIRLGLVAPRPPGLDVGRQRTMVCS
jgi:DNA-binding NarL/FixJ family response regulator